MVEGGGLVEEAQMQGCTPEVSLSRRWAAFVLWPTLLLRRGGFAHPTGKARGLCQRWHYRTTLLGRALHGLCWARGWVLELQW